MTRDFLFAKLRKIERTTLIALIKRGSGEQGSGVGVDWRGKDLIGSGYFTDGAGIHDGDSVRDVADDFEVMANKK